MAARATAFRQVQEELGVEFLEWEGWLWPSEFGDVDGEYLAVRNAVGIVDGAPLRKWMFEGPEAGRAADRLVTHDVGGMVDGQVHYTPLCADDGTMLDDITVFRFAADRFMLVAALDSDAEHFRAHTGDLDFEITEVTEDRPHLQIQGPRASAVLGPLTDVDLDSLAYFRFRSGTVAGRPCLVSRTGYSGEQGFELFCSAQDGDAIYRALLEAGRPHGIRPYGLAAVDLLRIECGLVIVGVEYEPRESTPFEINLGWAVTLDKGDFIGREALAALASRPPERRLVGVRFDGAAPEDGTELTADGEAAGRVTVARHIPGIDAALGLAVLSQPHAAAGTEVSGGVSGTVAELPFYPSRARDGAVAGA
jgi:aminomethyltransferase